MQGVRAEYVVKYKDNKVMLYTGKMEHDGIVLDAAEVKGDDFLLSRAIDMYFNNTHENIYPFLKQINKDYGNIVVTIDYDKYLNNK